MIFRAAPRFLVVLLASLLTVRLSAAGLLVAFQTEADGGVARLELDARGLPASPAPPVIFRHPAFAAAAKLRISPDARHATLNAEAERHENFAVLDLAAASAPGDPVTGATVTAPGRSARPAAVRSRCKTPPDRPPAARRGWAAAGARPEAGPGPRRSSPAPRPAAGTGKALSAFVGSRASSGASQPRNRVHASSAARKCCRSRVPKSNRREKAARSQSSKSKPGRSAASMLSISSSSTARRAPAPAADKSGGPASRAGQELETRDRDKVGMRPNHAVPAPGSKPSV